MKKVDLIIEGFTLKTELNFIKGPNSIENKKYL